MTRHSIVRSLLLIGWKPLTTAKGADDVTMIGTEGPDTEVETILGVDTHLDFHLAVALDHLGRRLGELSVPTTAKGYERLLRWAERFGPLGCAGVEGTSSYGAGLARHLGAKGIEVLEVERPERRRRSSRRNHEKSDPLRRRSRRTSGPGRRDGGRAQERRRPCGDDQGPARGPPLRDQGQDAGRQPAPGLARDGTGGAAPPFARTLDEGARLGGRTLPHRR